LETLGKASGHVGKMYLVVALKPKLEPLVNKKGLKWSDILPALNSISSVEALESAVSDPETFLAKLAKASGRAGQKYLVATLRPRLEPLMRKQGLKWDDVLPVLHATGRGDLLLAESNPARLLANFAEASGVERGTSTSSAVVVADKGKKSAEGSLVEELRPEPGLPDSDTHDPRQILKRLEATLHEENPSLKGLSPLYADYEAECWWWQILTFLVTLILCGPMLLLKSEAASQVFIQLVISASMMVSIANTNPYLHGSDDVLAQLCQIALTFTMSVGILEMASEEFQDAHFGPILVICTTIQLVFGFIVMSMQYAKEKMPNTVGKVVQLVSTMSAVEDDFLIAPRQISRDVISDGEKVAAEKMVEAKRMTMKKKRSTKVAPMLVAEKDRSTKVRPVAKVHVHPHGTPLE